MSTATNLKLTETMEASLDAHDLESFTSHLHPDVVARLPAAQALEGAAAVQARFASMLRAFPDLRVEQVALIGDGDLVCHEAVLTGTHEGPFMVPGGREVPPTRKQVRLRMCGILRFENGRVVEVREYGDQLGLLAQLGLLDLGDEA